MRIILEKPDGSRYAIAPGVNHPATDKVIGVENDDAAVGAQFIAPSEEDTTALAMLQEIEQELGAEKGASGDWVKFFAAPIAVVLDKEDCLSCEFRRVCLNSAKKLQRLHGHIAGKQKMKALILRSFTEDAGALGAELKALLS